jgi:hypothetical protein
LNKHFGDKNFFLKIFTTQMNESFKRKFERHLNILILSTHLNTK